MSDQGEIPDRSEDFGLIETLLWTQDGGFLYLSEHVARLSASARALGFLHSDEAFLAALKEEVADPLDERLRVRYALGRDGRFEASSLPIDAIAPETIWRVAVAEARFESDDPMLRHKTTRRELYERELAEAAMRCRADEVLFRNERDEVCEGARTNVFLARDGVLLTPPLSSGLLPGTLRAHLLASGKARESLLRLEDFSGDAEFYFGNSVRGLVRAALIAEDKIAEDQIAEEPEA
ncbi:aminotransferase class IV [Methylosinus sporium]|uniref:Probable branched-chain-amino-acid aminotransferase n=1 Tax=Methylosinus sporium TaxID=428 RepID=A0A549SUU9_METSR|nr:MULTISPECIES: aminotransferase class IV family protein [Methylosinus]MBU3890232.1 aminotransferase class IV family protein [Methylosinus sp. KRF6]TRL33400.1 aminotransferase class IV [Methylosinus sporium]